MSTGTGETNNAHKQIRLSTDMKESESRRGKAKGKREKERDLAFAVFPSLNELHYALRERDENEKARKQKKSPGKPEVKRVV